MRRLAASYMNLLNSQAGLHTGHVTFAQYHHVESAYAKARAKMVTRQGEAKVDAMEHRVRNT